MTHHTHLTIDHDRGTAEAVRQSLFSTERSICTFKFRIMSGQLRLVAICTSGGFSEWQTRQRPLTPLELVQMYPITGDSGTITVMDDPTGEENAL
jgi:hypothetical protein